MVLIESPYLSESYRTLRTSNVSSNAYILSIASLHTHYAASTSAPSNVIEIFDKSTLQRIQSLPGHESATTSLHAVNTIAGIPTKSLISSGKDGSVKVWDDRSNSHSIKLTNLGKSHALLCCAVSPDGYTVAAGTDLQSDDALILYWDPRQPATPLRTHGSTHSDDITALDFNESGTLILSASSDGLVSTSNPNEDDEDEAVVGVGNWGCSVSQAGWITGARNGSGDAALWAASDMETFSTWSEEFDRLMSLDIREPSVHTQQRTWVTDYLVTCDAKRGVLNVFTGSNEGDIALLSNSNPSEDDAPWTLHNLWMTGHVGVVRSLLYDEEENVLVTGGEDGKLNVWPWPSSFVSHGGDENMDVDVPDSSPRPVFSPPKKRRERDVSPSGGEDGRRDSEDYLNGEEGVKRARR